MKNPCNPNRDCEADDIPRNSDAIEMANFLKEINEEYGWNIPIDMDDIKIKLFVADNFFQAYHNIKPADDCCEKRSWKRSGECSPPINCSTLGSSGTSYSQSIPTPENEVDDRQEENPMDQDDHVKAETSTGGAIYANQDQLPQVENPTENINYENHVQGAISLENPEQPELENQGAAINRGGDEPVLVIRRTLCKTDTSDHHSHLGIPVNQIINHDFLTSEELVKLGWNCKIEATLIDPRGITYEINLRKTKKGNSYSYTIGSPWNEIRRDNGLETGNVVELRAFRGDSNHELYFILDRVE